jgi:hypothetical protein
MGEEVFWLTRDPAFAIAEAGIKAVEQEWEKNKCSNS